MVVAVVVVMAMVVVIVVVVVSDGYRRGVAWRVMFVIRTEDTWRAYGKPTPSSGYAP